MLTPLPHRGRVLFADDDRAAREGLAEMLRRLGYTCECAVSAADALQQLRAAPYDVLISDIHMPGNTALELVEAAVQAVPGLPVILLTGRPSVDTAARSVRLPVTAYLTKPPDLAEMTSVLDQAVADYRDLVLIREGRQRLRDWERELAQIEQLSRQAPVDGGGRMEDFIRVSLRQAILLLADLERATQSLDRRASSRLREVDHVAALRRTVEVLERTRQNFKSKDLADLRRQLEQLLEREPGSGDGI
ncbi:Nitrogen assimilation regulatory protein [Lacunisphaera limnophila]|uniref:Nitrogen assimilation regulatory protein n=1 Tax=Lacunisphaera limnophila TaxID=1838286 RepID=A0A1D8AR38_9BACT|nr:response regulator [Lacunisphaera limnophila]AOS43351.1 Nitrogen assimilation regulatory protein [Lacunisphaera limnophila]